ncbi:hypothetical protein DPMN_001357 [Dreissena polymorpha]|uniref:Uncharacterized protein n=1 Tax=Dreissena polymorpha TaxID=45954 RepID=A0A9D4MK60_DREPO|nr:hypothetical protein DPMN_001357 [Dreissena polymorpha]
MKSDVTSSKEDSDEDVDDVIVVPTIIHGDACKSTMDQRIIIIENVDNRRMDAAKEIETKTQLIRENEITDNIVVKDGEDQALPETPIHEEPSEIQQEATKEEVDKNPCENVTSDNTNDETVENHSTETVIKNTEVRKKKRVLPPDPPKRSSRV